MQGAQKQRHSIKKRQLQNAGDSKEKTSNEKRGNLKIQGAHKQRPLMKKVATLKCKAQTPYTRARERLDG
jgi:hypothetical protein